MRWLKLSLWVAIAVLIAGRPAAAQTTTGTITGRVVDGQGLSVPGVTVSVQGPNLQGIPTAVSSENGDYILPQLPLGPYTVTFELSGFERQQKTVALAPTQTLPLNVTMGPASITETITVIGKSADVLTQTAQVATNFRQDLIATLPTNRDINATMLMAPSVHPSGPSGSYSIAGAMSFESLYMVNGVTVNENLRGQPLNLYIEDAIQETTVATDGVSAEYGRFSGGVVNVITKSGGNLFCGSFRDTLNNDNWRTYVTGNAAHPFTADCATCGAGGTPSKIDRVVPQYEYVIGGPIARDRLWFFTAGRFQNQSFARSTIAPLNIPYINEQKRKRFEGKLTGSINANHRFEGAYTKEAYTEVNNTQSTATTMDLASLLTRQTPQNLFSLSYNGILSPHFFVEGRFSFRHFSFVGSGSTFTDRIKGTLMLDASRGPGRFWSPTFCGVCDDEKRDNDNQFVKATYFKSTKGSGSHQMVFGYDTLNNALFANNHQSGSDYRIQATTTIVRDGVIYPQLLNTSATWIRFNPISSSSLGTSFRSHGVFYNDNWRWTPRITVNLGLRYDKNHGVDSAGHLVANDSAWSPRVGIVWDPSGEGRWTVSASASKYVAALNGSIGDSSSAAGNPATLQWQYTGPTINADSSAPTATLIPTDQVIQRVFDWCNTDSRGLCRTNNLQVLSVPGFNVRIPDGVSSPNVIAYAGGISRQIGRGVLRADYSYRDYRDFYSQRIDRSTGVVTDEFGNPADLGIVENTSDLKRRYSGVTVSATYRLGARTDIGGNYTLSRLWGNFDGENTASGPLTTDVFQYPEYRQLSWYAPIGDLSADQRHRSTMWINYGVHGISGLTLSLLQDLASGVPYGAAGAGGGAGGVDVTPFVTNPGYANPQGDTSQDYYYTNRDAFRTENSKRTDFAASYSYGIGAGNRKVDLFIQAQVLNIFNTFDLCGCGNTVFSNGGANMLNLIGQSVTLRTAFNPFTTVPVEGVNWVKGANFGTPLNKNAFSSPRTFRMTFGVRF
jgi:outer membrane receptor protein involved in Fe transport